MQRIESQQWRRRGKEEAMGVQRGVQNPLSIECPFSSKRRSMRVTEKKEKTEKVREGDRN